MTVVRQPRVRILVTGNEVVAPGTAKGTYQIYDANSYMLRGLDRPRRRRAGERTYDSRDDPDAIREALASRRAPT